MCSIYVTFLFVCVLCVQFLSGQHIMDYSLIVGIHDQTQEDNKYQRNAFPMPADEEEEEEEGGGTGDDTLGEEALAEEEENGVEGGEGEGEERVPTPPDSPQPITPMPMFCGELDPELERFGVKSAKGVSLLMLNVCSKH